VPKKRVPKQVTPRPKQAAGKSSAKVSKQKPAAKKVAQAKPPRESLALKRERVLAVIEQLKVDYPEALCALEHTTPFQLLAATILSAQCTDERVNIVTRELFRAFPDAKSLAKAKLETVEEYVKSTGFFRAKAKNLLGMAQILAEQYDGEPPQDLELLIKLPGVGRKTANVLLGTWFGIPSGVVVDTHVQRITTLLGFTKGNTAEKIEADLISLVPQEEWIMFSHRLIHHGRKICIARRPKCTTCPLLANCRRVGLGKPSMEATSE
jgi:endonuclease III